MSTPGALDTIVLKEDEKEFLTLLGFLYLRYGKWEKAGIVFRALQTLFPGEIYFDKALCFAALKGGDYRTALDQAERLLESASGAEDRELGCMLKGRALWNLGEKEHSTECFGEALDLRRQRLQHAD